MSPDPHPHTTPQTHTSTNADTSTPREQAARTLTEVSQQFTQAAENLEKARERRDIALLAAYEAGWSKKELADISGLTAPGVAKRLEVMGVAVVTHAQRAERRSARHNR